MDDDFDMAMLEEARRQTQQGLRKCCRNTIVSQAAMCGLWLGGVWEGSGMCVGHWHSVSHEVGRESWLWFKK